MSRFFYSFLLLFIFIASFQYPTSLLAADDEIKFGKWIGYIQPEGSSDAISVSMDSYLVKPQDYDDYQHLELKFKLGLGGYQTSEYETETFERPEYDFEGRVLTLDEPKNDMVVTATVSSLPRRHMLGKVYLRSSATWAKICLEYQSGTLTGHPVCKPPPLAPSLSGQYEGMCGNEKSVFQLEVGKGLTQETPVPVTGLHHYNITGALGIENGRCPRVNSKDRPSFCVDHAFSSANYDFFQRKLVLCGNLETDECNREGDEFQCRMKVLPKDPKAKGLIQETCRFKKVNSVTSNYKINERKFHVSATGDQKKRLPLSAPPQNKDLFQSTYGSFYGYLHQESSDKYQPMRLDVLASNSKTNGHNENDVFVSVSAVLFFGRNIKGPAWVQQLDRRVIEIVPGYILQSGQSDTFLLVTQWKKGFISGDWVSKAYGKVGTFEVVKSESFPPLDASAKTVDLVTGQFRGSQGMGPETDFWEINFVFPKQPRSEMSYLVFQGNYQLNAGGVTWPTSRIEQGSYDFYSGAIAWKTDTTGSESKLVTGFVESADQLRLFWPSERTWAVGLFDFKLGNYRRIPE